MNKLLKSPKTILKIGLYGFLFYPLLTAALEESDLSTVYDLLKEGDFYTVGDFQGARQITLRYAKFGKGRGKNGSLVFVNGKAENLFKYIELFYDFYLQGWSPIYTYDHRNQGFSHRIPPYSIPISLSPADKTRSSSQPLPDPTPTDVENYSLYREDMAAFMHIVLNDSEMDRSNLFLIARSMGGAIALDYLQTDLKKSPFKSIALSVPMIRVKSNLFPFLENITLAALTGYCSHLSCIGKIPSFRNRFTMRALTHSEARYAFSEYVAKERFPQIASQGTSFRWVVESFKITDQIMEESRVRQMATPVIVLQSEKEYFVSNEYHHFFCDMIPDCCHINKISGKHELFLEKDKPRNEAIEALMSFFLNSEKYQKECHHPKS